MRVGVVDERTGGLKPGFSSRKVQGLEIDRVVGRFDAEIQLAADHRGFTLLGGEIGASDLAEIVVADRGVSDHDAQIVGGQLEREWRAH